MIFVLHQAPPAVDHLFRLPLMIPCHLQQLTGNHPAVVHWLWWPSGNPSTATGHRLQQNPTSGEIFYFLNANVCSIRVSRIFLLFFFWKVKFLFARRKTKNWQCYQTDPKIGSFTRDPWIVTVSSWVKEHSQARFFFPFCSDSIRVWQSNKGGH